MAPTCLTLLQKSKILEDIRKGISVTALSKQYGVAKSTICSFKKKCVLINKAVNNAHNAPGNKKSLKTSAFPRMERELYKWLLEQRKQHLAVSGLQLREKAISIHDELHEHGRRFTASDGWLQKFKQRHRIRLSNRKVSDNNEEADDATGDSTVDVNAEIIQRLHEPLTDPLKLKDVVSWYKLPTVEISDVDDDDDDEESNGGSESENETINENISTTISNQDAVEIFEKARQWAVQNQVDNSDVLVLKRLHEKAVKLVIKAEKK